MTAAHSTGPHVAVAETIPTRAPRKIALAELIAQQVHRHRRRQLLLGAALIAGVALFAALWFLLKPRPLPLVARFRTTAITQGDVVREIRATGHVEAVTTVQVGAEISGRIATVEADYNDRVKVGQVLARFDRDSLLAQLAQSQATLAAARAALEQAKTDRERSHRDAARASDLYKNKSISDAEHDNAVASARLAEQRVAAAEAQLAAQQAANNVAKTNLDHGIIHAPIDGIIITRNIDPGQTVASVFQTPVLFTVAADLRKMRVIAAIDEADIGEVAVQQKAYFTVNAYADRVFEGVVTQLRNSPVVMQDVVTYGAVIEVDNTDLALKPGMTVSARVRTASVRGALRVPANGLRFIPPGEKAADTPGVWILESSGWRHIAVQPGVSDGELTAVTPGSVTPGQQVIVDLTPEGKKIYGLGH